MRHKPVKTSLISSILVLSLAVVGCTDQKPASQEAKSTPEVKPEAKAENKQATPYPQKLTYWVPLKAAISSFIKNYNEKPDFQQMEKVTGTHVDFIHPTGNESEQLNLLIASRNLPDLIETDWYNIPGGPDNAIKQGTILRLNELIEKHAPNLNKYLNDRPELKKMVQTDEGNMYVMPFLRGDERQTIAYGPMLRKDLMDKLNLKMPETIDEWEKVLTALKAQNTKSYPLLLSLPQIKGKYQLVGAYGISPDFFQVDGKVVYGSTRPEFKEFLIKMNTWYKNGLIDPDFAALDSKLTDAKITGGVVSAFFGAPGGYVGRYNELMRAKDPTVTIAPAVSPSLEKGKPAALIAKTYVFETINGLAVSGTAKNPEQLVKWWDYAYGPEGSMLFNFGIEGVHYKMVNGAPQFTDLILDNPKMTVDEALGVYTRAFKNAPVIQDIRVHEQAYKLPEQKEAFKIWAIADNKIQMPLVMMTADEGKKFASIMTDVNTYWNEMVTKFIMGAETLSNFDKFAETIKGMNVDQAVKIQQAALERYKARK
jgi:putative aldouronate transport system substrate-binding protein